MWASFVDYLVDVGYTRECPGGAGAASAAAAAAAPAGAATSSSPSSSSSTVPTRLPAARRLVAIGDLHGDLAKARRAFALAGLIAEDPLPAAAAGSGGKGATGSGGSSGSIAPSSSSSWSWTGGDTVVVQVGDQLDRGDQELRILYFLEKLQREAAAAGGALHVLNGNHETMNAGGNFRYATAGADGEMRTWAAWRALGAKMVGPCCEGNGSSKAGAAAAAAVVAVATAATPFSTPGEARLTALAAPLLEAQEEQPPPPSSSSSSSAALSGPGKAPAASLFAAAAAAAAVAPTTTSDPPAPAAEAPDPQARAREVLRGPPAHTLGGGGRARQYNELRHAALGPGGAVATRFFAPHPTVLQVGSTLFVHGGVLPAHVEYGLERINRETEEWLRGDEKGGVGGNGGAVAGGGAAAGAGTAAAAAVPWFFSWRSSGGGGDAPSSGTTAAAAAGGGGARAPGAAANNNSSSSQAAPPPPPAPATPPPGFLRGGSAVVWARDYSMVDEARCDCDTLEHVLRAVGDQAPQGTGPARRMVVGHTIQQGLGVNAACGGRALRVDVGMSRGCGDGAPEVLEILGDGAVVRRLREGAAPEVLVSGRQQQQQEAGLAEEGRRPVAAAA
jgi:hypothetical protein